MPIASRKRCMPGWLQSVVSCGRFRRRVGGLDFTGCAMGIGIALEISGDKPVPDRWTADHGCRAGPDETSTM